MSETSAASISTTRSPIHPGAWIFWLAIQLGALIISASRFPFYSRFPAAGERFALPVMLVAQTLAASMLAPLLVRNIRSTVIVIATGWPMAALAALLGDESLGRAACAEAYVSTYIVALLIWVHSLRGGVQSQFVGAVATLLALGGPVLMYLQSEFGAQIGAGEWTNYAAAGPILGSISQILPDSHREIAWWVLISVLLVGTIALLTRRWLFSPKPGKTAIFESKV